MNVIPVRQIPNIYPTLDDLLVIVEDDLKVNIDETLHKLYDFNSKLIIDRKIKREEIKLEGLYTSFLVKFKTVHGQYIDYKEDGSLDELYNQIEMVVDVEDPTIIIGDYKGITIQKFYDVFATKKIKEIITTYSFDSVFNGMTVLALDNYCKNKEIKYKVKKNGRDGFEVDFTFTNIDNIFN